jgi:hypothetical protein
MGMYGDSFGVQNEVVMAASSAFFPRPGTQSILPGSFAGVSMPAHTAK